MKSTRVNRGVQPDEVWAAADAVLTQGERPTIERVRAHLGRGSPNTVAPMLDAWYASLGKRLASENGADGTGESGDLPLSVLRAAKTLWGRARQHALEQAVESVRVDREMLERQGEGLNDLRSELDQKQQKLFERSEALGAALLAKDQQIADLVRQIADLNKGMAGRSSEIEALRIHLAETTKTLQKERDRLNALTEDHRRERERLEQRASAHEIRLLGDVDRARLEVKRLKAMLADEATKAGLALAESREQVQILRVQIGALSAENAGLARESLSAREHLLASQAQHEQFRKETTDLLTEMNARISNDRAATGGLAKRPNKKVVLKR